MCSQPQDKNISLKSKKKFFVHYSNHRLDEDVPLYDFKTLV